MGRKKSFISKKDEFYLCSECFKKTDSKTMTLISRKIDLYPCGLPRIDGNSLYSIEEQDRVQETCKKLGRHEICDEKMARSCAEHLFKA